MECSYTHPGFRDTLAGLPLKTMLEIGSLHGLDAIEVMKSYSLDRVITVECNPECVEICRRNFEPHPKITLVDVAAWHEDAMIPFYPVTESVDWNGHPTHNIGASSCFQSNGTWPFEKYTQKRIEVPARRLDGVLDRLGVAVVDLICMDAQGAELRALQGLGRYLDGVQAIVTELELKPMYHDQSLFVDVCLFLKMRGFRLVAENRWAPTAGDFLFLKDTGATPSAIRPGDCTESVSNTFRHPAALFTVEDAQSASAVAYKQIAAGRLKSAETIVEAIFEFFPEFFPALIALANLRERAGDLMAAVKVYERAMAVNPGHALPFTRCGIIKFRSSQGDPPPRQPTNDAMPFVTMSDLGSNGRFGNQLLQYGLIRLYSEKVGAQLRVPDWLGRDLFGLNDAPPSPVRASTVLGEAEIIAALSGNVIRDSGNVDATGYFCNTTATWAEHREQFQRFFTPSRSVRPVADAVLKRLGRRGRVVVAVHIRRGDYGQGPFWVAPTSWYLDWLATVWPKLNKPVLYIATDDPSVVADFNDYETVTSADLSAPLAGAEFFVDHWVMRHADILATSNSTFSATAALLNLKGGQTWRPDRSSSGLRLYDPWAEPVLLV